MEDKILDDLWKSRHTKDVLFLSIIDGYEIKTHIRFPCLLFYIKNNRIIIEYDIISQDAYIDYILYGDLKTLYNLEYYELNVTLKHMLDIHLKLEEAYIKTNDGGYTFNKIFKKYLS